MEIKVNFDEFKVHEQRTPTLVKILMLKGEKGDRGTTDYNDLTNKPTALSDFDNDGVFITNLADDLVNYYKKSETYTQTEINNLVAAIPKFAIAVVDELPDADISTTTVYLVPSDSETSDIYKEYIYVNGEWELLGIQKTDLTDYYDKSQTDTLLAAKANSSTVSSLTQQVNDNTDNISSLTTSVSGLTTTVSDKADQSTVNAISSQVTTNTDDISGLTTSVSGLTTTVSDKADQSTVNAISSQVTTNTDDISGLTTSVSGKADKPVQLYYNPSGSNTDITLSQSVSNFSFIEIYYNTGGDIENHCEKIIPSLGSNTVLTTFYPGTSALWYKAKWIKVSGTTIVFYDGAEGAIYSGGCSWVKDTSAIYVIAVYGYN